MRVAPSTHGVRMKPKVRRTSALATHAALSVTAALSCIFWRITSAHAALETYVGPTGGSWATNTNWSPAAGPPFFGIPFFGDDVHLGTAGTGTSVVFDFSYAA